MKVTIPSKEQHEGMFSMDIFIRDYCPKCGIEIGVPYEGLSYDGSRRLNVSCWENPCGHVDLYSNVGKNILEKQNLNINQKAK